MGRWLSIRFRQKKTPAGMLRGFSRAPVRADQNDGEGLAPDIAADDVAEQVPFLALELHQLKLADRGEIGRAGVDHDAGQQDFGTEILQAWRLLHSVVAV